jgi:UDP-glucose 4-epimerase
MKKHILVSGAAGYIGAHTLVDLIENDYEVMGVDNFSRGEKRMLEGVEKITAKKVPFQQLELCNEEAVLAFFKKYTFDGIIHFAAYKAVGESVLTPLLYYQNNIQSLLNLLHALQKMEVPNFIFSSSCSVYGELTQMPVDENTPLGNPLSPYGRTKQIGEEIIKDVAKISKSQFISLRYFNPVGAHPSALIGEIPYGKPNNVVPAITQFASGKQAEFCILGTDYPTPDGTCIRDYVHVCDIARAHRLALEYSFQKNSTNNYEVFNLGSGQGLSVKEIVAAFEKVSGQKLNYTQAPRRSGDVSAIYTSNKLAHQKLNWQPEFTTEEMLRSAWEWEKSLK